VLAQDHPAVGVIVGNDGSTDATAEVLDSVNQTAETDARFLRRLAAREEFDFFVDDGGLHWRSPDQSRPPSHVLTWYSDPGRGDVLSVSVESDLARRVESFEKSTLAYSYDAAANALTATVGTTGAGLGTFALDLGAGSAIRSLANWYPYDTARRLVARARRRLHVADRDETRRSQRLDVHIQLAGAAGSASQRPLQPNATVAGT